MNKAVLTATMELLNHVCEQAAITKMSPHALGVVMGPNVLKAPDETSLEYEAYNQLIETMLLNYSFFFEESELDTTGIQESATEQAIVEDVTADNAAKGDATKETTTTANELP